MSSKYSALIVESPSTLSPSRQKLSVLPPRSESSTNNVQPGCNVVGNSVNICLSTLQFTGSFANEGYKHGAQVFHRVNHQLCAEQNQISVDCSGTIAPQTGPCTARACACVCARVCAPAWELVRDPVIKSHPKSPVCCSLNTAFSVSRKKKDKKTLNKLGKHKLAR